MRSALLVFFCGLAHAAPLPDGLRLEHGSGRELNVVRGKERGRVPMPGGVLAVKRVRFDRKTSTVTLDYTDGCDDEREASWSLGALKARLENAIAFRQLGAAHFDAAAAGFREAVALDDKLDVARTNLASALVRKGDRAGALTALQPLLDAAPVVTYAKIAGDADLAPLLEAPQLARLRAAHRGTASVSAEELLAEENGRATFVAITRDLVAVGRVESSWGADCYASLYVTIVRAADGALVTELPLGGVTQGQGGRCVATPSRGAHVLIANRVLADLGFEPAAFEAGKPSTSKSGDPTIVFAHAKLGIVSTDAATRVLSGDHLVTTAPALPGKPLRGMLLPAQHLVVLGWLRGGREGCESVDPTGVVVLPLP